MTHIIDKRFTQKDGAIANRQKFIERYKASIKDAIRKKVDSESIKDFDINGQKIKVKISRDEVTIPDISFNSDEIIYDHVAPGNKVFKSGDKIKKEDKEGRGGGGSETGGGEDDFEFTLSREEFINIFFEDLELPDLVKKQFTGKAFETQHCGYSKTGGPSALNAKQTLIRACMRVKVLKKKEQKRRIDELVGEIETKKKKIPFIDEPDLRYNHRDKVEVPATRAVMFALMDVSGSMGVKEKDIAKRFFILLSLFLRKNYDMVEIVFVRHAEWAEECDEDTFFRGRESGGTIISSGYEKVIEVIRARYSAELWNIYIAQVTDGDNWPLDNDRSENILTQYLLPISQYFAYVEVGNAWRPEQRSNDVSAIFKLLEKLSINFKNLAVKEIQDYSEIFEVFRSLFTRRKIS